MPATLTETFNDDSFPEWEQGPAITNSVTAENGNFTATTYEDGSMIIEFGGGANAGTTVFVNGDAVTIDKWGEMDQQSGRIMNLDEPQTSKTQLHKSPVDPLLTEEGFKQPVADGMSEDGFASISRYEDGAYIIEMADGPNAGTTIIAEQGAVKVDNWGELNENNVLMSLPEHERIMTEVSLSGTDPQAQQGPALKADVMQP